MAEAPDQWDWAAAGVPSALTPELDQQHQAKEVAKAPVFSSAHRSALPFAAQCSVVFEVSDSNADCPERSQLCDEE